MSRPSQKTLQQRLADGVVVGAEGYVFELERRGYIKAGPFVPEVILDEPDALRQLHRVMDPDRTHVTDQPRLHGPLDRPVGGRGRQVVVGRHHHACGPTGPDHGLRVLEREREGLLGEHVLSRCGCRLHVFAVPGVDVREGDAIVAVNGQTVDEGFYRSALGDWANRAAGEEIRLSLADGPLVLVVGSEGKGLSRLVAETCDHVVAIPMAGPVESLNAGVAAGVALYEVARQRHALLV